MGWQKCPVCSGTGKISNTINSAVMVQCHTCNGRGIINELTGLPPKVSSRENLLVDQSDREDCDNVNSGDFRDGPMESLQEYFGK